MTFPAAKGSKLQRSLPVTASRAITRSLGVVAYKHPVDHDRVALHLRVGSASPVSKVQATWSLEALERLICESVE